MKNKNQTKTKKQKSNRKGLIITYVLTAVVFAIVPSLSGNNAYYCYTKLKHK